MTYSICHPQGHDGSAPLILVRGLPGSGKSTYAANLLRMEPNSVHLEADMWFSRSGTYEWVGDYVPRAHRWCIHTAQVMMRQGKTVIVSDCTLKFKECEELVSFAKRMHKPIEVKTMTGDYGSIHDVPDFRMQRLKQRFVPHDKFMEQLRAYQPA